MQKLICHLSVFFITLFSTLIHAATIPNTNPIQLHQSPDTTSKVIGTLKPGDTLIPIFQKNDWVEIGNPSDGTVGWAKQSEMQKAGYPTIFIRTFNQTPGQSGYKVIQYTGNGKMDQKQIDEIMKHTQKQQADFQKAMNQLMEQNATNLQRFNQQFQQLWENNSKQIKQFMAPILQPVIVVPPQQKNPESKDTSQIKK